jgi:hypothetical protein
MTPWNKGDPVMRITGPPESGKREVPDGRPQRSDIDGLHQVARKVGGPALVAGALSRISPKLTPRWRQPD